MNVVCVVCSPKTVGVAADPACAENGNQCTSVASRGINHGPVSSLRQFYPDKCQRGSVGSVVLLYVHSGNLVDVSVRVSCNSDFQDMSVGELGAQFCDVVKASIPIPCVGISPNGELGNGY
jgi:hypothetical protein